MEGKLLNLSASQLLEKFGAGNHKPGSGSAAALQGMLSAQMLRTVIDLTKDPKREAIYAKYIPELLRIKNEIESRIYSDLENLFQLDSEQFDQVIKLREQRDKEPNFQKKRELKIQALEALKPATETLVKIAERCLELGDFAVYVFDNGFKSARGDSGVAINSAISSIACCLSIIELNLTTLPIDERTEKIRLNKTSIKSRLELLSEKGNKRHNILEKESDENKSFLQSIEVFRKGNLVEEVRSNADIEKIVKDLQNTLWLQREKIWKKENIENPMQLLQPAIVFQKVMDYSFSQPESLGIYEHDGEYFETAGLIDKSKKLVKVSKSFSVETQNFTAAHELGHAILHKQTILHRDRPLDGSSNTSLIPEEAQANKFAAFFLMPEKLVRKYFTDFFRTNRFAINQDTAFFLSAGSPIALKAKCADIRGLGLLLATTDFYAGKKFNSLASIFRVSASTMAIRLEELELLEF
jgi:formiminotetrahydrofolate cyclodeaminase